MSLKTKVIYPIPLDNAEVWTIFKPFVHRFVASWKEHPPGDCELVAITCQDKEDNYPGLHELLSEIKELEGFHNYYGQGMDLGAQQWYSQLEGPNTFVVNLTTRMYFHRPGAIDQLTEARKRHGRALYGMSASKESGRLHICTRGHSLNRYDFGIYPTQITSRNQGVFFECGDGCLTDWMEEETDNPGYVVTFNGVYTKAEWLMIKNGFRDGDQSALLMLDRHSDIYRDSDANGKMSLRERMLLG